LAAKGGTVPEAVVLEFHGSIADSSFANQGAARILELPNPPELVADQIADEIRKKLPIGAEVQVQIDFRLGSLEWAGIVLILDWMGRLSGSIALGEYLVKTVEFAVNRVLRRHIPFPPLGSGGRNTAATIVGQPASPAVPRQLPLVVSLVNTILLIAILLTLWLGAA
jgi:hypothetical protein